jgi:hypothetical protein
MNFTGESENDADKEYSDTDESDQPSDDESAQPSDDESYQPSDDESDQPSDDESDQPSDDESDDQNCIQDQDTPNPLVDYITQLDAIPTNSSTFWKYLVGFVLFYLLCWIFVDKTDLNTYSNFLCFVNGIIMSITSIWFVVTFNPVATSMTLASAISYFCVELIVGTMYYPERMPLFSAYIHHILYTIGVLYTIYFTNGSHILTFHAIAELPTVLISYARIFQIKDWYLDGFIAIFFGIFRILLWFIYLGMVYMWSNKSTTFKIPYFVIAGGGGVIHIQWMYKLVMKLIQNYNK